jgi:hypothetical protein
MKKALFMTFMTFDFACVCVCVCVVAIYSFFLKYVVFLFVLQNSGKSESSHSNSLSSDVVTETGTPEADSTDDNNEQGETGDIGHMCDVHQELCRKVNDKLTPKERELVTQVCDTGL